MSKIRLSFLSAMLFFVAASSGCAIEVNVSDLTSNRHSVDFNDPNLFEFNDNYVEIVDGKVQLKPLDLLHSGEDFSRGSHVGSLLSSNSIGLKTNVGDLATDVGTILPSRFENLVGYWRMENNWLDSSSYENHGTSFADSMFTSGYRGGSTGGHFDGFEDKVEIGNPVELQGSAMTVSFWAKPSTNSRSFLSKGQSRGTIVSRDWDIFGDGTDLRFIVSDGLTNIVNINFSGFPTIGEWHHIVATWDGSTSLNGAKIYVDGSLFAQATATATGTAISTNFPLRIGGDSGSNLYEYMGDLDEVAIWNTPISADEVLKLYQSQRSNFTELSSSWTPQWDKIVGYWKMDGNGKDTSDSPISHHGALLDTPTFTMDSAVGARSTEFSGDGEFDQIMVPHHSEFSGRDSFSVGGWIKFHDLGLDVTDDINLVDTLFVKGKSSYGAILDREWFLAWDSRSSHDIG